MKIEGVYHLNFDPPVIPPVPSISIVIHHPFNQLSFLYFAIHREHYGLKEVLYETMYDQVTENFILELPQELIDAQGNNQFFIQGFLGETARCKAEGSTQVFLGNPPIHLDLHLT